MFNALAKGPSLQVAIIRSTAIGDVILATACIQLLIRLGLPLKIFWLGRQPSLNLIKEAYPELTTIELKKGIKSSEAIESLGEADFIVDLQGNLRSRLITRAFTKRYGRRSYHWNKDSLARRRIVWEAFFLGRNRILPERATIPKHLKFQTMASCLLEGILNHVPSEASRALADFFPKPFLPTAHDGKKRPWQKELQFGRWVAIAPGASFASKRTPVEVLVKILIQLRRNYNQRLGEGAPPLGLLFLGDFNDRNIASELINLLGWNDPVLNLAGKLTLWENALALKEVSCLLSNDSALGHIAEAVQRPACVIFGPTSEAFGFAPHLPQSQAFSIPLGCRPCSLHGQKPCRYGDYKCFFDLPIEKIADKLLQLTLAH